MYTVLVHSHEGKCQTGYTALLIINLISSGDEWPSSKDFTKTIWEMENKYHGTWTINKLIIGGYWTDLASYMRPLNIYFMINIHYY
jgi:hypothetical protein